MNNNIAEYVGLNDEVVKLAAAKMLKIFGGMIATSALLGLALKFTSSSEEMTSTCKPSSVPTTSLSTFIKNYNDTFEVKNDSVIKETVPHL